MSGSRGHLRLELEIDPPIGTDICGYASRGPQVSANRKPPSSRRHDPSSLKMGSHRPSCVSPRKTAQPFGSAILITFHGLRLKEIRHGIAVYATLGKVGNPSKELQGIDPGHVLIYEGFEVRLMDTEPFSVKFLVTRL